MTTSVHRTYRQTGTRILARYCIGRPLDGYPRTNSTFFRKGDTAISPTGRAGPWSYLPGWQRAAVRLTAPPASAGAAWLLNNYPAEVTGTAGAVGGVALTIGACRVWGEAMEWRHQRGYVEPLHTVLSATLGVDRNPSEWIIVPRDFANEETSGVVIKLPQMHISAEVKKMIRDIVSQKLGIINPVENWHIEGNKPYVVFAPEPAPPKRVTWVDIEQYAQSAKEIAPIIGISRRGAIVDADLEADSPHILISAGSGGGKSVLTKSILAQGLSRGGLGVVLDFKRTSHRWAQGLPNVKYCKTIAEIHDALIALGQEAEARNIAGDSEDGFEGPRIFLLAEEMNATIFKLKSYWDEIRGRSDPKRSPAIAALCDVLFMGRSTKINVLAVAQMMTAATLGGPEARENFATRCLTRYTLNAWKMLAPEVWPAPRRSRVVGRWQIVKGGVAHEVQVAYLSDQEARQLALEGCMAAVTVLDVHRGAEQGEQGETVPGRTLTGLRAALAELPGAPISLGAIRKAAQRDGFPPSYENDGAERLYDLGELVEWKTRRDALVAISGTKGVA